MRQKIKVEAEVEAGNVSGTCPTLKDAQLDSYTVKFENLSLR